MQAWPRELETWADEESRVVVVSYYLAFSDKVSYIKELFQISADYLAYVKVEPKYTKL